LPARPVHTATSWRSLHPCPSPPFQQDRLCRGFRLN
jgi:hypothetical protein